MSTNTRRIFYYGLSIALLITFGSTLGQLLFVFLYALQVFLQPHGTTVLATLSNNLATIVLDAIGLIASAVVGVWPIRWIRRDETENADAASSLVRSDMLNLTQAVVGLIALFAGLSAPIALFGEISPLASGLFDTVFCNQFGVCNITSYIGILLISITSAAVVAFVLVQLELGRAQPGSGTALVVRRAHLYLFQIITTLTITLALIPSVSAQVFGGIVVEPPVYDEWKPLLHDLLPLLWGVTIWMIYRWLTSGDSHSTLRLVTQFVGFGAGLVTVVVGVWRLAYLAILLMLHIMLPDESANQLFVSGPIYFSMPLLIGLLIAVIYRRSLLSEAARNRLGNRGTFLTGLALSAVVFGVPFFIAAARLLMRVAIVLEGKGSLLRPDFWAYWAGMLVVGLAYPVLLYLLWQRSSKLPLARGPWQMYLLVGLGTALLLTLAFVGTSIYLIFTQQGGQPGDYAQSLLKSLQAFGSALINVGGALLHLPSRECPRSPTTDCGTAIVSAIPLLVGGAVALAHYWRARVEGLIQNRPSQPRRPKLTERSTLADLRAGRITREEAMTQLQALVDKVTEASRTPG